MAREDYWYPAIRAGEKENFEKLREKVNKQRQKQSKPKFTQVDFVTALIKAGNLNREDLVEI